MQCLDQIRCALLNLATPPIDMTILGNLGDFGASRRREVVQALMTRKFSSVEVRLRFGDLGSTPVPKEDLAPELAGWACQLMSA